MEEEPWSMTLVDVASALSSVPLFSGFSQKQLKKVAESGEERRYRTGTTIMEEKTKGAGLYMVLHGNVEVRKGTKVLARLSKGQFFGDMSLIDEQPRSANVVAVQPTECFTLSPRDFYALTRKHPELLLLMLKEITKRLRLAQSSPVS